MLFKPFPFCNIILKNRLVRSATFEKRADVDGFVTDELIDFYKDLVNGGIGLIITGNAIVHLSGINVPNAIGIHNDFYIANLKKLTDAVHRLDGKIFIQLCHSGRQTLPLWIGGKQPIAPSEVFDPSIKITPREMTQEDIWEIIYSFSNSARRALVSGFDGIQIHGAHGYLVNQFLSPHTNRRNDYWGGDEERRFHFIEEVYYAMKKEVGEDFPITIKLNADDFIEGGLTLDESLRIAERLQSIGMASIEVSGGMYEAGHKTIRFKIKEKQDEAYFRNYSKAFKNKLYIPIMLVGGIRSREVAEEILQNKEADLISLSRPLIREPDLPLKFQKGKEKADCISCNHCMRYKKLDVVRCVHIKTSLENIS